MATELGQAYVQIIPSFRGLEGSLAAQLGGGGMGGIGHTMGLSLGKGIIAGVGALGIGKALKDVVFTGMDFDKAMSQVAATMGLSMDEMANQVGTVDLAWGKFSGNLREYAQEMGENTAFSASESAEALNYMALAGYDAQTAMSMLPNVLNLAAAGNFDLARASDMVTDTQTAFGLSLERTSLMVDEMAKAASTGNTSVEQLGDAFLVVGGLAKELNGGLVYIDENTSVATDGVQELEIALTAMANAGIKGSEAGTHMRNMLLKLSSPTAQGVKSLEALGVSVFDAQGNMRALSDVFQDLSVSMNALTQEQKLQAISDIFNTRDVASAEALMSAISSDWDEIGASILDAQGAAQKMADTQLDNLAGDVTLFKSALEGAQIALSDGLAPSLREFVQSGTTLLSNFASNMKTDGIVGAVSGIGRDIGAGLVQALRSAADNVRQNGAQIISDAFNNIGGLMIDIATWIPYIAEAVLDLVGAFGQAILETDWSAIMSNLGSKLFNDMSLALAETFGANTDDFGFIDGLFRAISAKMPTLMQSGVQILTTIGTGIINALPTIITTAGQIITSLVGFILENAPTLILSGIQLIVNLAMGLIQAIPQINTAIGNVIKSLFQRIVQSYAEGQRRGLEWMLKVGQGFLQAVPKILQYIANIVRQIISKFTSVDWGGVGSNIIHGIASGITAAAGAIAGAVMSAAQNALNAAKNFLGIKSPSRLFANEVGRWIPPGIAQGIENNMSPLESTIAEMKALATSEFNADDAAIGLNVGMATPQPAATPMTGGTVNVYMTVNAGEIRDIDRLAELIEERLTNAVMRRQAAYA